VCFHDVRRPPHTPRHTDWISGCALIPSSTAGIPPSAAASSGRDGSVRFWFKSGSAAATAAAPTALSKDQAEKAASKFRTAFALGSRSSSGRLLGEFVDGGGGGGRASPPQVGSGGWSMATCMPAAHGSPEFVTCCASPVGTSGAAGGWVATGGTDWSVRCFAVVLRGYIGTR